jgi:hypothetical protein
LVTVDNEPVLAKGGLSTACFELRQNPFEEAIVNLVCARRRR